VKPQNVAAVFSSLGAGLLVASCDPRDGYSWMFRLGAALLIASLIIHIGSVATRET
jgi:hypothetical protein